MEKKMISKNLTEIPSTGTYSDKEHKPVTAIEFESWIEDNNIIGYVMKNRANPGFYESSENLSPSEIHQELYNLKLKVGATKPNIFTRGEKPRRNKFIKSPRLKANADYIVMFKTEESEMNSDYKNEEIKYKFDEDLYLEEVNEYVNSTYSSHYSKDKFQATEFIMDGGHGTGFCIGNVLKYAQRYGKKGTAADARRDLMKVLHYALMQLYVHDNEL